MVKQRTKRGGSPDPPRSRAGCHWRLARQCVSARWVRRPTAHEPRFSRGARPLLLAACFLSIFALPLAGGAGPQQPDQAATVPQKVQAHLAAAHRARSQLAEEAQAWAIERERLQLLVSAVRQIGRAHV